MAQPGTGFHVAIPARYASTRFPGKPLVELAGRTMLEHVWRCAVASGADSVAVATDDRRIAQVAEGFGATACLTRADHASGTDRLAELVSRMGWAASDIVVNLQGDEPLTPPRILEQAATDLVSRPDAAVATLATPLTAADDPSDPDLVKVVTDAEGFALYFSRAAIPYARGGRSETPLLRHVGIYAYRVGFLQTFTELSPAPPEVTESLEQLRALWHGYRIHVAMAEALPGPGVDSPDDVAVVAARLAGC